MVTKLQIGAIVAVGLMLLSLSGLVVILRAKLDTVAATQALTQEQLAQVLTTNKEQAAVIDRLTQQRRIDDRFVALLNGQLAAIKQQTAETTTKLIELERTDPDAKAYLDTPIPPSVRQLLDK